MPAFRHGRDAEVDIIVLIHQRDPCPVAWSDAVLEALVVDDHVAVLVAHDGLEVGPQYTRLGCLQELDLDEHLVHRLEVLAMSSSIVWFGDKRRFNTNLARQSGSVQGETVLRGLDDFGMLGYSSEYS